MEAIPIFLIWIIIAAITGIGELATAGFFLLPFAIGALVTALISYLGASLPVQVLVFIVVSLACLALIQRFARRVTKPEPIRSNVDRLIGLTAVVLQPIDPETGGGMVRVGREEWKATLDIQGPSDGTGISTIIPAGASVRVLRVEGTRVMVRPE